MDNVTLALLASLAIIVFFYVLREVIRMARSGRLHKLVWRILNTLNFSVHVPTSEVVDGIRAKDPSFTQVDIISGLIALERIGFVEHKAEYPNLGTGLIESGKQFTDLVRGLGEGLPENEKAEVERLIEVLKCAAKESAALINEIPVYLWKKKARGGGRRRRITKEAFEHVPATIPIRY